MLYHWLYPLTETFHVFNLFRYITVRSFLAFIIALGISLVWGKIFINVMRRLQFGQVIRSDGPESHHKKKGTPTAGGVFVLGSVFFACAFCGNFSNPGFLASLFILFSYFLLGGLDDYLKVMKKNSKGVSGKFKLAWQFSTSLLVGWFLIEFEVISTSLHLPFLKGPVVDLGFLYIFFISLVVTGSSNAVNLTDGLDGLAIGPIIISAGTLGLLVYLTGHSELADYLLIPYVRGSSELLVLASALIGAGTGFLWFNSHPAQIFMGDAGSLSLGGGLGILAVLAKSEILFVFIGGIFVMEAVSVILQVLSFKTRGKRIFRMAPIHHHFELKGWAEPKVIVRFWIISLVLAILSLASLKLR